MSLESKLSFLQQKLDEREELAQLLRKHKSSKNRGNWYYEEEVLDFIMTII